MRYPTTAQVMDLVLTGKAETLVTESHVGRTRCASAIYHEGLWYKITVQTCDTATLREEFGDNNPPENIRDPEYPDRLAEG